MKQWFFIVLLSFSWPFISIPLAVATEAYSPIDCLLKSILAESHHAWEQKLQSLKRDYENRPNYPEYVPMDPSFQGEDLALTNGRPVVKYFRGVEQTALQIYPIEGSFVDGHGRKICSGATCVGIFVMDRKGRFYFYQHDDIVAHYMNYKEHIRHSSLTAGGPVAMAGELAISHGRPVRISNDSGHYKPRGRLLEQVFEELGRHGIARLGHENIIRLRLD